jgi:hypothetical protein
MIGPLLIGLVSRVFALSVGFVSCGVLALLALVVAGRQQVTRQP